ncbi:hypothetical protein HMPREF1869_00453 [Bacteroidales bacterium KA00251]|nr:hypothetical protein HMPREF1869_00453 [Bacteroidales bacterium KA00251]
MLSCSCVSGLPPLFLLVYFLFVHCCDYLSTANVVYLIVYEPLIAQLLKTRALSAVDSLYLKVRLARKGFEPVFLL